MAKEIFGYARVSTKDQNVDRQIVELRKYVKRDGHIYIDRQTGKNFERDAYQQMKAALRDGDELYIKSLDRFGRNKQQIKDELQELRKKGVLVHILDFPQTMIRTTSKEQREILDLATNIIIEVLGYVAEKERENIKQRQTEGIASWRRTGKTKTGKPYGRPRKERPKNFEKVYGLWKRKEIKSREAWELLHVSHNIFYRMVKEYEGTMP